MPERKWFHAPSADAETWEGPFGNREGAELDGRAEYCGCHYYVRQGERITIERLLDGLDLPNIIERLDEYWADNHSYPEDHDTLVEADDTAAEALHAWARAHLTCRPWWEMCTPAELVQP